MAGTFTEEQKEACYRLFTQDKTGKQIQEACAAGVFGLAPFTISEPHARNIGRKWAAERGDLYKASINADDPEASRVLHKRLLNIADREASRLEHLQKQGKLDPRKLERLASALSRVVKLGTELSGEPKPSPGHNGNGPQSQAQSQPDAFLSAMADDEGQDVGEGDNAAEQAGEAVT